MMDKRTSWLNVFSPPVAGIVCAVLACLLIGGAVHYRISAAERATRLKLLQNMTAEKRAVLQSQFEAWKKLPESERNRWRAFHDEVEADKSLELQNTLDEYMTWLGSLSLPERDRLRQAGGIAQRMSIVREVAERQSQREQFGQFKLPKPGDKYVLSRSEFEEAMKALMQSFRENLPDGPAGQRVFQELRRGDVFAGMIKFLTFPGFQQGVLSGSPAAVAALESAESKITDASIKSELDKTNSEAMRRYRIYLLLARTALTEAALKIGDPTTEEGRKPLEKFFVELNPNDQDLLMQSQADLFWLGLWKKRADAEGLPSQPLMQLFMFVRFATWDAPPRSPFFRPQGGIRPGRDLPPREVDQRRRPFSERPPGEPAQ